MGASDFDKLIARAQEQHARVEQRRMATARTAFRAISNWPEPSAKT